jgi:hypothetical protein
MHHMDLEKELNRLPCIILLSLTYFELICFKTLTSPYLLKLSC